MDQVTTAKHTFTRSNQSVVLPAQLAILTTKSRDSLCWLLGLGTRRLETRPGASLETSRLVPRLIGYTKSSSLGRSLIVVRGAVADSSVTQMMSAGTQIIHSFQMFS